MYALRVVTLLVLMALWPLSQNAFAHKVNLFAYVEGGMVYTESYFPDGRPVAGGRVLVQNENNVLLQEGTTNEEGLYSFAIPAIEDLVIVIDATLGHKNSFRLKKEEVEAGE